MSTKKSVQFFLPHHISTIGPPTPSRDYQLPTKEQQILAWEMRMGTPSRHKALSEVSRRGRFFDPFVLHFLFGLSRRLVFSLDVLQCL